MAVWVASFVRDGFVGCAIMCDDFMGCVMCLMALLPLRWIDGVTTAAVLLHCCTHLLKLNSKSVPQYQMRVRAYCAPPSISGHRALRCMSGSPDQVVSLKRDPQCLRHQASLVLIY
ncbi:hypothetical protein TNCV_355101 [Trichonephila clavipes]|uniref:Uncharacterized protein n=1 Tax=Trichonephila clavipes TaxID=2585209 RepID=A0A8X7BD20_TRICX|nr:hypothetical protein TNCV_355101 [Trichonephila clavipes]